MIRPGTIGWLALHEAQLSWRDWLYLITGGHSLYQARKDQNPNIHPFPSSVDVGHFGRARRGGPDPAAGTATATRLTIGAWRPPCLDAAGFPARPGRL